MNIIFDLDDTLYLEKLYIYQGFWEVSQYLQQHLSFNAVRLYQDLINLLKKGSQYVFDELKVKWRFEIDIRTLVAIYRNAPRRLRLLPDVDEACKALKRNDHHLILLTNGDSETQWKKIKALNLEKLFNSIMAADDYGKEYWKPSAKIMSIIHKNFGEGKNNYLVVGNGTDDLGFAQNAGLEFIFIKRPHQLRIIERFQGRTIENLNELLTMEELMNAK